MASKLGAFDALSAGFSVGSAFGEARNRKRIARLNARVYEEAAMDALARGQIAVDRSNEQYAQATGSARASMAARGVALDEGSPLQVLASIDRAKAIDAQTISSNATREARGLRVQAWNARAGATGAYGQAVASLLDGTSTVAARWYSRNKVGA